MKTTIIVAAAAGAAMGQASFNAVPLREVMHSSARVAWFGDSFSVGGL